MGACAQRFELGSETAASILTEKPASQRALLLELRILEI